MRFVSLGIYIILFCMFVYYTINRKNMYAAFILVLFGTRGLAFLPAETAETRVFTFLSLVVFCLVNFGKVVRGIKHNKVIRSAFWLCVFFLFSMAFSVLVWNIPIIRVMRVGLQYMTFMSIVVFAQVSEQEYHKLFTAVFWIAFVAAFLYVIQSIIGRAILPTSLIRQGSADKVKIIAGIFHRFWNTPPFVRDFILISMFCKELIPKRLQTIAPMVFFSALFCTMFRTAITAAIFGVLYVMYLQGSLRKNIKPIAVLLLVYILFGSTFSERVTRNNNATFRDISALLRGDFDLRGTQDRSGMTLMYRVAWFIERGEYLLEHPVNLMMGLPLTDDKKYWYRHYNFKLGLDYGDGYKEQATTPDIAYGNMETRYGLIGSLFMIRMIYLIMKWQYKHRRDNNLAMTLCGLLWATVISSMAGTAIAEPLTYVGYFFLFEYAQKQVVGEIARQRAVPPPPYA